jgi:predicted permease
VLVLGHHYWKRRFGGDRRVVGSRVTVNGSPYTIVGVTPPGFVGTNVAKPADFWVPLTMQVELMRLERRIGRPDEWWLLVLGRLRSGVSLAAAEAKVNVTLQQFLAAHPQVVESKVKPQALRIGLDPGAQGMGAFRRGARDPLLALMAGAGLLLLIVLVNVSHLVLARASARRREMSIRTALGATPGRLAQQLLAEGLLLSTLGAGAAALVTPLLAAGLVALAANLITLDLGLDGRVLSFMALLALATTVPLGLLPAWQLARADPQQELRATAHTFTSARSRRRVSRVLVTSQVALSLALLFGAGLLSETLANLRSAEKGFEEEHVLLVETNPGMAGLKRRHGPAPEGAAALYDAIVARVAAVPGVKDASLSVFGLLSGGGWNHALKVVGSTAAVKSAQIEGVSSRYFETVGMRLLRGRSFTHADDRHAPRVAVINETLARQLFDDSDPLGHRMRDVDPGDIEVVGIVRDAKMRGVSEPVPPTYFVPLDQQDWLASTLEVRTAGDPALAADAVRAAMREADPRLPVLSVRTMRAQIERTLVGERLMALLSGAFGLSALFLVCVGLYGVMARWSAERTGEIGVRMALGATTAGVQWMVMRQGLGLVLFGVAVGLPLAMVAARLLRTLLFGIAPVDLVTLAAAFLALVAVALVAVYLPARRASRIDPLVALRCE